MIVAVTGADPVLTAVKGAILPEPEAANPMEGVLLVQLKTTPAGVPAKLIGAVNMPLQTCRLVTGFTVVDGQAITRFYVVLVPVQLLASVAVTVMGNVPV